MDINDKNFVTIQGWMRTELDLKGNDLLVYAVIYGFSQTACQKYTGGLQYLADWCGCTKQGILKNLNNLLDRKLIEKEEKFINNVKFVEYHSTQFNTHSTEFNTPIKLSLTNNIDNTINNNIDNTISNEIVADATHESSHSVTSSTRRIPLVTSIKKEEKKEKKKSLYEKCMDAIEDFTEDKEVREKLKEYLLVRLERKDKPFGANTFASSLKKLRTLTDSKTECLQIIQYSIDGQYGSFYELKKDNYKKKKPRGAEISGEYGIVKTGGDKEEKIVNVQF